MEAEYLMLRERDLNCDVHVNSELEVVFVERGEVVVRGELEAERVCASEAMMIFPYRLHGFSCSADTRATVFMFSYPIAEELYNTYKAEACNGYKFFVDASVSGFVSYCLKNITPENNRCIVKSILYAFAASCMQGMRLEPKKAVSVFSVQEVVEYIFFHLSDELTLQEVAGIFCINKNTLGSLFRDTIGISFGSFVNNVRVERAKTLLQKSSMTVTEIAYECGFGCVRSFNRAFAKCLDITPIEYRKKFL